MDNTQHNFPNMCRSCLCVNNNMKCIFEANISDEDNIPIVSFINRMTALEIIRGDGLPASICLLCVEKLCKAYNFTQLCVASDITLKRLKTEIVEISSKLKAEDAQDHETPMRSQGHVQVKPVCPTPMRRSNRWKTSEKAVPVYDCDTKAVIITDCNNITNFVYNNDENVSPESLETDTTLQNDQEYEEIKEESLEDKILVEKSRVHRELQQNEKKFGCSTCSEIFTTKLKLARHEKSHDAQKPYKCEQCLKTFNKKAQLTIHIRTHVKAQSKEHICEKCGQKFAYSYLLKQHSFKHSDEKPFPCTKCEKGCLTAESLRRHMKVHDENYVKKMHICKICSKEFPYPSFLAEHMKNHTGERPFLCSTCGKGFRQGGALEYHIRSHTGFKPYTCHICNNNFMSRGKYIKATTDQRSCEQI